MKTNVIATTLCMNSKRIKEITHKFEQVTLVGTAQEFEDYSLFMEGYLYGGLPCDNEKPCKLCIKRDIKS